MKIPNDLGILLVCIGLLIICLHNKVNTEELRSNEVAQLRAEITQLKQTCSVYGPAPILTTEEGIIND